MPNSVPDFLIAKCAASKSSKLTGRSKSGGDFRKIVLRNYTTDAALGLRDKFLKTGPWVEVWKVLA